MDNVLIVGGSGMLGHKVAQVLSPNYTVWATVRDQGLGLAATGIVPAERIITQTNVEDFNTLVKAVSVAKPKIIINCVGIIKQLAAAKQAIPSIEINALFPQRLNAFCGTSGIRLIHISTDCVFSGERGGYSEDDIPDAKDLYGRSKLLGEVVSDGSITLRTSIIGRALHGAEGLIEWFLAQKGKTIKGYTDAVFSGVTTETLAETIRDVVIPRPELSGLYHVSAMPINKMDLLTRFRAVAHYPVEIVMDKGPRCNRSLDSKRFSLATGWMAPDWDTMLSRLAQEVEQYEIWRKDYVTGK